MNAADLIIGGVIAALLAFAVWRMKRKGRPCCASCKDCKCKCGKNIVEKREKI